MSGKVISQSATRTHDVIMAGLGGSGVLLVGETLLHAAAPEDQFVTYFPTYGTAMRGGNVECSVVLSDERIGSPMLPKADAVMVFDGARLPEFEGRVRPGGLLILESTHLAAGPARTDITVLKVPAREIAINLGDTRAANQVMLGAYIEATEATSPETIEKQIEKRLKERNLENILALNVKAFREGIKIARGG